MRILVLCVLLSLVSVMTSRAQNIASSKLVDLGASVFGSVVGANVGMGYSFSRDALMVTSFGAAWGQHETLQYQPFWLDCRVNYNVMSNMTGGFGRKKSAGVFSVVGGVVLQYDRLVGDFQLAEGDTDSSLNFGVEMGGDLSFTIDRALGVYINAVQKYFVKEDFGQWRYQISVGLRRTF